MAEMYMEALAQVHDKLVAALSNYVNDIEKQLNEKDVLSKYQAGRLREFTSSKLKIEYILKDCIQFQLSKNKDSQFQVLRDFMRSAANSDQKLVPLVVHLQLEEKSVPLNPSHQVTDNDNQTQQATDDDESGIGMHNHVVQ